MKRKRNLSVVITAALLLVAVLFASCQQTGKVTKTLMLGRTSLIRKLGADSKVAQTLVCDL